MALADFYSGYNDARKRDEQSSLAQTQVASGQMGILSQIQKQAMQQQAAQRGAQYRQEMSLADTPEKQRQIVMKYGDVKDVAASLDRQAGQKATQEAARTRLASAAQSHEQGMAMKKAQLDQVIVTEANRNQVSRARLALDTWDAQQKNAIKSELLRLTGEKGTYDYGGSSPALPNFGPAPGAPVVPSAAPQQPMMQGQAPAGGGRPMSFEIPSQAAPVAPQPDVWTQPQATVQPVPPNNMDARDLRLQGTQSLAQIAQQTAPAVARTAPTYPAKPPEYASWPQRKKDEYDSRQSLAQTRPSIAGNANILPETATRLAQQMLAGDSNALAGMARNQTGLAQVQNEITRLAEQAGKTGADITGAKAMTAANRTALTAITRDLVAITPFKEMLNQNAQIAIDLGRKIADDKTNSAFINRPLLWVKNNLSDRPDIAEYLAQMHFVEVEAARVLTQPRLVGQLTDQAISDMKSILSGNMTIASTEAVINRIMSDGNNRTNAMVSQQKRLLSEISGKPSRTRSTDGATGVDTSNPLLR